MREGYKPWEFRRLTLREALAVCGAHKETVRYEMQRLATVGSFIANFAGMGSEDFISPDDLIPDAFASGGVPSQEWMEEMYRRHERRLEGDPVTEEELENMSETEMKAARSGASITNG